MKTSICPTVFPPGDSKYYRNNALQKIGIEVQLFESSMEQVYAHRGTLCKSSWGLSKKMPREYEGWGIDAGLNRAVLRGQVSSTHSSGWVDLPPHQSCPLAVDWCIWLRGSCLSYEVYFSFKVIYSLLFCALLCVKLRMRRGAPKIWREKLVCVP